MPTAANVNEFEASVERWMDANPRQPRERKRQYARRALDAVKGERAGFDPSFIIAMLPIILRIIEMIIERI